jgi:hypothetical protein
MSVAAAQRRNNAQAALSQRRQEPVAVKSNGGRGYRAATAAPSGQTGKYTVEEAMSLVTMRLSRLETEFMKRARNGGDTESCAGDNMGAVFERLETLESAGRSAGGPADNSKFLSLKNVVGKLKMSLTDQIAMQGELIAAQQQQIEALEDKVASMPVHQEAGYDMSEVASPLTVVEEDAKKGEEVVEEKECEVCAGVGDMCICACVSDEAEEAAPAKKGKVSVEL